MKAASMSNSRTVVAEMKGAAHSRVA
jgi:hypothetical protein